MQDNDRRGEALRHAVEQGLNSLTRGGAVQCTICGRRKKPVGRDSRDNGLCDGDCEGYRLDPYPGNLWPGEVEID